MKNSELVNFFSKPPTQKQKQYEAVRAIIIEKQSVEVVAKKFNYKTSTIYSLMRDAKKNISELFPVVKKGPLTRRVPSDVQDQIIENRKKGLSVADINALLEKNGIIISAKTVERILNEAGFKKLKRRTNKELGRTAKNKSIPETAIDLNLEKLKPFNVDCPSVGVFFFIPYIIESGLLDILEKVQLPQSGIIGSKQACLSMLLLKLLGGERLCHIDMYNQEPGFGIFAGLNVLPKPTYISTYSCGCTEEQLMELQQKIIKNFKDKYPANYSSEYINLDFHSIPHFGDYSEMEKVWCGAKNKTMKGANTIFAQDSKSSAILYTRSDILRKEESVEVKKFISYWKEIKGEVEETLVFDCRFSNYKVLDEIAEDKVKFITLRKRYSALIKRTLEVPEAKWEKVYLSIPKRKYKHVSVYENRVTLKKCKNSFRQIIVKDHGRSNPTFILTNNETLPMKDILEVYARRWRIENKLAELVSFFNLNALSSPIMVRIHFDIIWTMVADTLYHLFAAELRRFEKSLSPQIFRNFINMPGKVVYDGNKFLIKIRKRSHTPILREVDKLNKPFRVPWLNEKYLEIKWTA